MTVIDDFAHHPTAVRETSIGAARARLPGPRDRRRSSSRAPTPAGARCSSSDYAEAFAGAASVLIRSVPDTPIYSATGPVTERLSSARLAADLSARGIPALAFDGVDAIVAHAAGSARPGDVLLVMSNGDFGGIWQKLLDAL